MILLSHSTFYEELADLREPFPMAVSRDKSQTPPLLINGNIATFWWDVRNVSSAMGL
jgi:hypothetical protein